MKAAHRRIKMLTAYDYPTAAILDECDIDAILVGDSLGMVMLGYTSTLPVTIEDMIHHTRAVVRGAPHTLVVADMPFASVTVSHERAIENAARLIKEAGADAVKVEGGGPVCERVKGMVEAGIPVMGHLGLTPQSVGVLGGYKVQGKDERSAMEVIEAAKALEQAGVFAIVLECIPARLAEVVTSTVQVPTIGIGAGPHCDGQVLVLHDLIGLTAGHVPKFVKRYADLRKDLAMAVSQYAKEVDEGVFPDEVHSFGVSGEMTGRLY